jgi:hypothetical protein
VKSKDGKAWTHQSNDIETSIENGGEGQIHADLPPNRPEALYSSDCDLELAHEVSTSIA